MDAALEGDYEFDEKAHGLRDGREWANKHATYEDLKTLAELDTIQYFKIGSEAEDNLWGWVNRQLGKVPPDLQGKTDYYTEAYIKGAQQVWNEVR